MKYEGRPLLVRDVGISLDAIQCRRESMTMPARFPPGSIQRKHPTKATKLQILEFVAGVRGADYVSLVDRFGLSESGARVKMSRLREKNLVEPIPNTIGRERAWQLTKAGWRYLRYLQKAEQYLGGTKGLLISNLTAEVARLKAENDYWKGIIEDRADIFQQLVDVGNENAALQMALDDARAEVKRLRAQVAAYQSPLPSKPRTKL
jgi:hypothetical protein